MHEVGEMWSTGAVPRPPRLAVQNESVRKGRPRTYKSKWRAEQTTKAPLEQGQVENEAAWPDGILVDLTD